jgi:hypothetical protein
MALMRQVVRYGALGLAVKYERGVSYCLLEVQEMFHRRMVRVDQKAAGRSQIFQAVPASLQGQHGDLT